MCVGAGPGSGGSRCATLSPDGDAVPYGARWSAAAPPEGVLPSPARPAAPLAGRTRLPSPPPLFSPLHPPALSPLYHLFSLFLLRPRVRLSPFMASFPPSLPVSPPSAYVSSRCFARSVPLLSSTAFSLSLCLSLLPSLHPLTCPPSRRPPPFQLDSLAAYPLSVVGRRSLCVSRDFRYLCLTPVVNSPLLQYPAVATSFFGEREGALCSFEK